MKGRSASNEKGRNKSPSNQSPASIKRRQNRILSKRIPKQKSSSHTPIPEEISAESTDEEESEEKDELQEYPRTQKNLQLYQYSQCLYPTENDYQGYSSARPQKDGDAQFYPNSAGEISKHDVKRLSNWNRRFRACLNRLRRLEPTSQLSDRIETNLDLMHLAQDFIYAATAYGKIIISEYYLPRKEKTIKPCALGGLMGGQKYIVHNILFKFAVDNRGLFGSDYAAAKVAGNELRGLISYFNCHIEDLNVPLMALVDYRGFRLIAMSILPVGEGTIIYGSCDAGRNIHATNERLNELMARAAEIQNLKPHFCRVAKQKSDGMKSEAKPPTVIFQMPSTNVLQSEGVVANDTGEYQESVPPPPSIILPSPEMVQEEETVQPVVESTTDTVVNKDDGEDADNEPKKTKKFIAVTLGKKKEEEVESTSRKKKSKKKTFPPLANPYENHLQMEEELEERMELLYSPADLEGHLGRDNSFYLLDFSRVLPPETPHKGFKNSHLSRLLRPEFWFCS
eukprot:TRINITY_DN14795_c0_g1_i2.p1 TRINITY_DN14795_c0_g1~~TRINITY_DN14795_c0_g1_i2.p1  ORF type:complete len:549 (+),score=143.34 TRINITY_DN14795_c0_g1_i2:117-1649(+)